MLDPDEAKEYGDLIVAGVYAKLDIYRTLLYISYIQLQI